MDGIFLKSCLNYINFRVQSRSYCLLNKERFYYLGCILSLGIEEITPLQYGWMYFLKRHSKMITFIADVSPIHCNTPPIATYYPNILYTSAIHIGYFWSWHYKDLGSMHLVFYCHFFSKSRICHEVICCYNKRDFLGFFFLILNHFTLIH